MCIRDSISGGEIPPGNISGGEIPSGDILGGEMPLSDTVRGEMPPGDISGGEILPGGIILLKLSDENYSQDPPVQVCIQYLNLSRIYLESI